MNIEEAKSTTKKVRMAQSVTMDEGVTGSTREDMPNMVTLQGEEEEGEGINRCGKD